jgi:hypothetical protein
MVEAAAPDAAGQKVDGCAAEGGTAVLSGVAGPAPSRPGACAIARTTSPVTVQLDIT